MDLNVVLLFFGSIVVAMALWCAMLAFVHLTIEIRQSSRRESHVMADISSILASLTELTTIDASLDALFVELQALIAQGASDPAKLQQAEDLITAHKDHLKAAILANTPSA